MKNIALSLVLVLACSAANAAEICDQRAEILKRFVKKHGETLFSVGVGGPRLVYENYVNQATGTFTYLRTIKTGERSDGTPIGYSCVIGLGGKHMIKTRVKPTKHTFLWWGGLQ